MPKRYKTAHKEGIAKYLSTGKSKIIGKTYEVCALRKDGQEIPVELSVASWKKDGKIYLGKSSVTLKELIAKLSKNKKQEVYLKADKDVPYGNVVTVMGELREIGIEKLGMVTEPKARIK